MSTRIFFLLLTQTVLSAANPQLAGRVEDSQGNPVAGARIRAYPAGASTPSTTTSNASGAFEMNIPSAASYLISASTQTLAMPEALHIDNASTGLILSLIHI